MNYLEKLQAIMAREEESAFAARITTQLGYLDGISKNEDGRYDAVIEAAADHLLSCMERDGVITKAAVAETEEKLMELQPAAKSYKASFVSHAHIDMNWQWGYNETAALTVDTFRTILTLMREYPAFTYAQSQASTYEIVERFAPELLPEIKERIHEGRWEVTATEWVEADKNMPDGESLTRQILQAKKYLCELLDLPPEYFVLDFVPDTFGHNANIPEILNKAGIRYMYHCRGYDGEHVIYRFTAPSGKSVLTYREYEWYNSVVRPISIQKVAPFCGKNGIKTCLCVYGVGDHGGGPSRRDIERILEYRSWPLTPTVEFGTFRGFFEELECSDIAFPVVDEELNFIFTGCYTTQTRIKMANRMAEARMNEAEALTAMAAELVGAPRKQERFDRPWRDILFNHFHDIIPGSGTVETTEYALGKFQDVLAVTSTASSAAMRAIAEQIDTSSIPFDEDKMTVSEGGGVGFYQAENRRFRLPCTERGRGSVRVLHLFNTTARDRREATEVVVWDYHYDLARLQVSDAWGKPVDFEILKDDHGYWGHKFTRLLVDAAVPAFGYTTLVLSLKTPEGHLDIDVITHERTDDHLHDDPMILENEHITAVFDRTTCALISLFDKNTGEELISEPSCTFRLIQEEADYRYTAWRVGPYVNVQDLNETCNVVGGQLKSGKMSQWFEYELKFGDSKLKVQVTLKKGSKLLEFQVTADWRELPVRQERIPQLNFAVPVNGAGETVYYDIPYGILGREQKAHDVPALSYLSMNGVGIISDGKYGFRCYDDVGSVTLIRTSYNPDPAPDQGKNIIRLAVAAASNKEMKELSENFNHPLPFVSGTCQKGALPLEKGALTVDGACVSCLKNAEDNEGAVLRLYNPTDEDTVATVTAKAASAILTDTNERPVQGLEVADGKVQVSVPARQVITVKLQ